MARDSKAKRSAPAGKKARGGTLIGMFIGLVLGVALAAGVVWYMNRTPMPFVTKSLQPPPKTEPEAANGKQPAQPLALPGKPGDPPPEKRFQFYDILPGKADAVPGAKPADAEVKKEEAKKDETKDARKEESKQALFLQAGSFSKPNEADNLKASLALMGLEASVLQVMVQDKTYYRVRLGPYNRIDEVNRVRADLAKAGIDASLVKKEP